jgi:hypothetical protein
MSGISDATIGNANPTAEQLFGKNTQAVRAIAAIMLKLHELFPEKKFAANVAARARVHTRTVEHWDGVGGKKRRRKSQMSAVALINLLFSDEGGKLLDAAVQSLPAKDRPAWVRRHMNTLKMTELEMVQARAEEALRELRRSMAES